jgi:lysophospholipase L1-like esterase
VWASPVVVCFGDSLTEGTGTSDGCGYPDFLSRRLGVKVWNAGIAGNRLLRDGYGERGLRRFHRDALEVPGITHVIVELGINDLGLAAMSGNPPPGAEQLTTGLATLARAARRAGVTPIGATLPPTGGALFPGFHSTEGESTRQAVNAWLRSTAEFTAVVDVDLALRDPDRPACYRPDLDSGDHLHPNDAGAEAIARSVDLEVFG